MKAIDKSYDYIVVGGGTAGCILASRLAEEKANRVLLIEAGERKKSIWLRIPLGVGRVLHNPKFVWKYLTEEIVNLNRRRIYKPMGKILGGSSAVNGMVCVRGSKESYDCFKNMDCPGWGYDDVLPYFKKMESFGNGDSNIRGTKGPIKISKYAAKEALSKAFIRACQNIGIKFNDDYNGQEVEGVSHLQFFTHNGLRESIYKKYIVNKKHSNLEVKIKTIVKRIIFKENIAYGVEVFDGQKNYLIIASKEIILCSGAIKTPQILELSGVGNKLILEKLNIPVVFNSPNVGENLIDHLNVRRTYRCKNTWTINDALTRPYYYGLGLLLRFLLFRTGLLSTPSATVHAIIKTESKLNEPDLKIQLIHLSESGRFGVAKNSGLDKISGFSICVYPIKPKSKGSTHILDQSFLVQPRIDPNYLSIKDDIDVTIKGLEIIEKIANQGPLKKYIEEETTFSLYDEDKSKLLNIIKRSGHTTYHFCGTCKMGKEQDSVVDERLRVYGVKNLRIVDASIFPIMVSTNTQAPTMMVAEKAADIIKNDNRLCT